MAEPTPQVVNSASHLTGALAYPANVLAYNLTTKFRHQRPATYQVYSILFHSASSRSNHIMELLTTLKCAAELVNFIHLSAKGLCLVRRQAEYPLPSGMTLSTDALGQVSKDVQAVAQRLLSCDDIQIRALSDNGVILLELAKECHQLSSTLLKVWGPCVLQAECKPVPKSGVGRVTPRMAEKPEDLEVIQRRISLYWTRVRDQVRTMMW